MHPSTAPASDPYSGWRNTDAVLILVEIFTNINLYFPGTCKRVPRLINSLDACGVSNLMQLLPVSLPHVQHRVDGVARAEAADHEVEVRGDADRLTL